MSKKVTIQDIADSLGLSRTTVSKALNGSGQMPEKTRNIVINKAKEMKYKQFAFIDIESNSQTVVRNKNIAMITRMMPNKIHFGSMLLSSFEKEISQRGYSLIINILQDSDIRSLKLPASFDPNNVDGIICVELFDADYSKLLCSLGKPILFADTFWQDTHNDLPADVLMMENKYSTSKMVQMIIQNGARHLSFVGDRNHCLSFYERWDGFCHALSLTGIPVDDSINIIDIDALYWNTDWLTKRINSLPQLPDAFICANDALAIQLITTLKKLNIRIPDDVLVCGFDNAPETSIVDPPLTTVNIPSDKMGFLAAQKLFMRMQNPGLPFETSYIRTQLIFRKSSGKIDNNTF